jgi:DNA-binding transcriptional LysR family regulator
VQDREVLEADGLRAFAAFAEHLNFTTAAAQLHLSQPALHVKIRKLGASLGVELYERYGRGLVLTEAGQRLAEFARDHRRQVDDFLTALHPTSSPIAIAAGRSTLRWVIGDGIQRLVGTGRAVRVVTADRTAALADVTAGRADVAVIAHTPPPPTLRSRQLAAYPQVLVVPAEHRLAGRRRLRVADLDGLDLVVPPAGRPHRETLERHLHDAGATCQVTAEVDGWDLLVHFAGLGMGATVVNGCVPAPDGLTAVPITDLPTVAYWGVWRPPREALVRDVLATLEPGDSRRRAGRRGAAGPGR